MSTQQSGGTPHTCKALEHCHKLNERVADLESELATPSLRALVGTLRDELAQYRSDSLEWHNALAQESRAQAVAIQALEGRLDATFRPEMAHCPTCTCGQTEPPATDCGGCAGQGSHKRWCPQVVGEKAARLGELAEEAESIGDRIGANDPTAAHWCYNAAAHLTGRARQARVER